ncbi:HEAT repeat domain-containing protein [Rhabdochlamydiaceae symbiont of Dictyostelium giganteum]|uniref:HEAT repeat domain-containing protein n=1 Tax=Rhabdochlamydiaceae symbiont of Dictyostelium giganteum TaxID=3342349 RepID=UPI00384B2E1B
MTSFLLMASEERGVEKVHAHIQIHDPWKGAIEGKKLLEIYPGSSLVRLAYIEALSAKGDERGVFQEWMTQRDVFSTDKKALEILAWTALQKAKDSPQLAIQTAALIGSALTSDAKSIPVVMRALRSQSAILRFLGVRLLRQLGDDPLICELIRLFHEEKVWFVRQAVIETIGELRLTQLKAALLESLNTYHISIEEKTSIFIALTKMHQGAEKNTHSSLFLSPRSALRELACHMTAYYDLITHIPDVEALLLDHSPDVRQEAIKTLLFLQKEIAPSLLETLMKDSHPKVAITAAWAATCLGDSLGVESLKEWMFNPEGKWRREAASLLSRSGSLGHKLSLEMLHSHEDAFVRVNLALGLIEQGVHVKEGCEILSQFLQKTLSQKLMWSSKQVISPSDIRHMEQSYNYPHMISQLTRLDLMRILCTFEHGDIKLKIKSMLMQESLEVTALAASILFQEGDEDVTLLLQELMHDSNLLVRVQSALILAVFKKDPDALKTLQVLYEHVDYEIKIQILEVISQLGSKEMLPFLLDRLEEPFQLIRVIAASAIIQCLSH